MGPLGTVVSWAKSAWSAISGLGGDVSAAVQKLWAFANSIHGLVSWLFGFPLLQLARAIIDHIRADWDNGAALWAALHRLPAWIWAHQVHPVSLHLNIRIGNLFAWTLREFVATWAATVRLVAAARAYTRALVAAERAARVKAVAAEHAAMLTNVRALHQQVEKEAASGYATGTPDRKSTLAKLLADVAERDPAVKGLVGDLAGIVLDVETVDNPLLRYAAGKILTDIIGHLGIDQAITALIQRLLDPLTGSPRPAGLYDVAKDTAARLGALEAQWADFMAAGGPEVEQAGQGWKDLTGLTVDAAALAFFAVALDDPQAWAAGVADTIGAAAAAAMGGIVDLVSKA